MHFRLQTLIMLQGRKKGDVSKLRSLSSRGVDRVQENLHRQDKRAKGYDGWVKTGCSCSCSKQTKSLPVVHVGHELHLLLHSSNLLSRGRLRATETEERHLANVERGINWFLGVLNERVAGWLGRRRVWVFLGVTGSFVASCSFSSFSEMLVGWMDEVCKRFCRAV